MNNQSTTSIVWWRLCMVWSIFDWASNKINNWFFLKRGTSGSLWWLNIIEEKLPRQNDTFWINPVDVAILVLLFLFCRNSNQKALCIGCETPSAASHFQLIYIIGFWLVCAELLTKGITGVVWVCRLLAICVFIIWAREEKKKIMFRFGVGKQEVLGNIC